jgi:mRNA interferase MazF
MAVRRGDVAAAGVPGDYGKPRPVVIVQDDAFDALASVTVLPLTTELHDLPLFRIAVEPSRESGLEKRSQVMADKATTVRHGRIRQHIGRLDATTMQAINQALARFLGLS